MKFNIGDIVYSPPADKHGLITGYISKNLLEEDSDEPVYQLLCLEDGEYYVDRQSNADKHGVKVA